MWHFVSVAKLITIQQTAHKIVYYGRSQIYVEFRETQKQTYTNNLFKASHHNDFYHSKMYDALIQRIKQNDFKFCLEDNFDMICIQDQHNV